MADYGIKDCVWTDKKRTIFGLPISFTRYFLTPTKFISRVGFLNITEEEIDLYKVTDKKIALPFWQRMFGCGTVTIFSRDTDEPEKPVWSIKNPREFSDLFDQYVFEQRDRYAIRGRDMLSISDCDCESGTE